MLETAQALLDALGAPGRPQDTGATPHDLWMDCSKIRSRGILFDTTAEGFQRCIQDYALR